MTITSIVFTPGIQKNLTEYLAEGGWVDCDKIRFRSGVPIKLGGWTKDTISQYIQKGSFSKAFSSAFSTSINNTKFTGVVRESKSWSALDSSKLVAAGSNEKVELLLSGQVFNITPIRETVTLSDAISTRTASFSSAFSSAFAITQSTLVQITDANHNLSVGDYINVVSQEYSVSGMMLSGEYKVHTVIDLDNYLIDTGMPLTTSVINGGGELVIEYFINNGYASNTGLTGWSGGTWGTPGESGQGWNRPREGNGTIALRQWSFDTWGEDLVACYNGGPIYHWDKTAGPTSKLTQLSNAPERNDIILVSQPSRFLIAFGTELESTGEYDPLLVRWADQETLNDWTATTTNASGEYRLSKGNRIVSVVQTRSEILILTETTLYTMRYTGGNSIFTFSSLDTDISIVSKNSAINNNGLVRWLGTDGIYMYNGVIHKIPSSVDKFLFDETSEGVLNFAQKEKTVVGVDKEFNELFWFYPSGSSIENSRYVKYNFIENVWDIGTLARTSWINESGLEKPHAFSADGYYYTHNSGYDEDGAPMNSYVRSGYFDIGDGEDIMLVDKIIPDVALDTNKSIDITVYGKMYPHPTATVYSKGPYTFNALDDKIDMRIRCRQFAIKYEVNTTGGDFEIGKVRLNIMPDGKR